MPACLEWGSERHEECSETADRGYNECTATRDEGYRDCCDWWPCSWLCDAWVWISNIVCIAWTWVSNVVCVAWNVICRLRKTEGPCNKFFRATPLVAEQLFERRGGRMANRPRSTALWRATLSLFVPLALGGCITTHLELDRMTGTAFPPHEVVRDGGTHSLGSIYVKAGHILVVEEDESDIAPLEGDCISNAELDALETSRRQSQVLPSSMPCTVLGVERTCTRYQVYGVVVNHFGMSNGACNEGLLGRMWTTDNRRAFAMFYRNTTVSTDNAKYLRSAAHEIGHAYNLHHEDGDGVSSIMNQTGVVGNNFKYEFSANSKTHLSKHPAQCKFPGTGVFYDCVTEHSGWHGDIQLACEP